MINQRFIEIGEGYADVYELFEIIKVNEPRLQSLLSLNSEVNGRKMTSFVAIFSPVSPSNFQPLYICREGIPIRADGPSKRWELFNEIAEKLNKDIITLEVKPSIEFHDKSLFYQYLIGVLRMNRIIQPLD